MNFNVNDVVKGRAGYHGKRYKIRTYRIVSIADPFEADGGINQLAVGQTIGTNRPLRQMLNLRHMTHVTA